MTEPRRLKHGGGAAQRLLDSASLDRAGATSRERIQAMVSTSSAFSQTPLEGAPPRGALRTFATWASVGVAASVALGFAASSLSTASAPAPHAASSAPETDIVAEPMGVTIEPWVGALPLRAAPDAERDVIEQARLAIARGDAATGFRLCDDFVATRPSSALRAEAEVLRVQALWLLDRRVEALSLAERFRQRFPGHPLAARLPRADGPAQSP